MVYKPREQTQSRKIPREACFPGGPLLQVRQFFIHQNINPVTYLTSLLTKLSLTDISEIGTCSPEIRFTAHNPEKICQVLMPFSHYWQDCDCPNVKGSVSYYFCWLLGFFTSCSPLMNSLNEAINTQFFAAQTAF